MKTRYLFGMPFATLRVQNQDVECLIDTGFNGSLLLPIEMIKRHNLTKVGNIKYVMANGAPSESEMYEVEIQWQNKRIKVNAIASDTDFALIGMELLKHSVSFLMPGRNLVTVEPI